MLFKLIAIGCILGGIAALLILVSPQSGDSLLDYFEGVDDSDKTPVLLRYTFKPGQKLVFESTSEIISTLRMDFGPGGGIMSMMLKPEFMVKSVDENGIATIEVTMKELALETGAGMGKRKVEITPAAQSDPYSGTICLNKVIRCIQGNYSSVIEYGNPVAHPLSFFHVV